MYGIAYVIIPMEIASLQHALDDALAPFQRGGPDEFPHEKLAFNDVTGQLRHLHCDPIALTLIDGGIEVSNHATAGFYLDDRAVRRFLQTVIVGDRRHAAGQNSSISSGPSRGRDVLGNLMRVFGAETPEFEAEISSNVELVSTLLDAAGRGEKHAFPTAIVLPVGACVHEFRWFDTDGGKRLPQEIKALLAVPDHATFKETALAAYARFSEMAVAGIAYHF